MMEERQYFQPASLSFDELDRRYPGIKWRLLRRSKKGNRVLTGSNFDARASRFYLNYDDPAELITTIWAVVNPAGSVLEYSVEDEWYYW